ncbi:hypothetical protein [Fimbriimonas ginsengisoli]|uniref:Uncharacterized protein n=1 Tax=Fimbriimonas ginsengisoli Gsoil 348 TaxID=661478 RepID=A0A068NQY8_FIMGI|nr:hypothetical protein [Fimbriimonas ginsengisoli]AIE85797.1 hypothetical protein OP10G_2429 [Fimbriimonas ginsengisoli Gsoil 348]
MLAPLLVAALLLGQAAGKPDPMTEAFQAVRTRGSALHALKIMEDHWAATGKDDFSSQTLGWFYSFLGETQKANEVFPKYQDRNAKPPIDELDACRSVDAVEAVVREAKRHQVLMINEMHHVPQVRTFILAVMRRLRSEGYRYYAAETFQNYEPLILSGHARFDTGRYTLEPLFGQIVREMLMVGYQPVAYESTIYVPSDTDAQAIARRETEEAHNLIAKVFHRNPRARVLVHAGGSHIYKASDSVGNRWMAARLIEETGLDVFTVDTADMREESPSENAWASYDHVMARHRPKSPIALRRPDGTYWTGGWAKNAVDLQVFFPRTELVHGRPNWITWETGRRLIPIPFKAPDPALRYLAEASVVGEPEDAIPVDRVVIWPGKPIPYLALPPGQYEIRFYDEEGRVAAPMRRCISVDNRKLLGGTPKATETAKIRP